MSDETPEVGIVVPCYNAARHVDDAIRSVVAQDYPSWRMVLVDDGSSDGTGDLIAAAAATDPRIIAVSQPNGGVARARNTGFEHIHPDSRFVLFLDADDVLEPTALSTLRQRLIDDDHLCAAFGRASLMDIGGVRLPPDREVGIFHYVDGRRVRSVRTPPEIGFNFVVAITPISTPGQVLIRRSLLDAKPLFDPALAGCEDWDLWLRLSRRQPIGFVDREVLRYRKHVGSISSDHGLMQARREATYDKHHDAAMRAGDHEAAAMVEVGRDFGLFGYDARLHARWSLDHLLIRDLPGAARLMARSLRYGVRFVASRVRLRVGALRTPTR